MKRKMWLVMCLSAAQHSSQAFGHHLLWWFSKQLQNKEKKNNESRVEKEQNPYLGRPSSSAPDLKGKQEHSQQWTRVHGKVVSSQWQKCFVQQATVSCEMFASQRKIKRAFFNHWLECFGVGVGQKWGKRVIGLLF